MYTFSQIYMSVCPCMYACMSATMNACMYRCVNVYVQNLYFHVTLHIFDMFKNKYDYHITNICHPAFMLNRHTDPTVLHESTKTKSTTYYVTIMYISTTNMCLKCHTYATFAN